MPEPLTEKYRPRSIDTFVGLDKPKLVLARLVADPFPSAWLFVGPPGVGKTTMAQVIGDQLPAEMHHVPSRECDLEMVRDLYRQCHFAPLRGAFHLVYVDEADQMTAAAQLAFLSKLDSTAQFPQTIVIFTANTTEGLEKRFLSRCRVLEFSSYGMGTAIVQLLERVWKVEAPSLPYNGNLGRIVKDATNNVRDALLKLEVELMVAA